MADEKKPTENKKKSLDAATIIAIGTVGFCSLAALYCEYGDNINQNIYIKDSTKKINAIYIEEDALVYGTLTNALTQKNGMRSCYDSAQQRFILSAFYECNNEFIRININDADYNSKQNELIENGGEIVCYITTIDGNTPEGFYRAEDIKNNVKQNQHKQKTLN